MEAKDRLVLALDVQDMATAISLLDKLQGKVGMVKVNSLASACPEIVQEIKNRGLKVWRDWKHHDIPGTVVNFIKADVDAGIDMCTVHTLGGYAMMRDAVIKAAQEGGKIKILGITVLTSHSQESFNEELGIPGEIQETVKHLALLTEKAKLDGVVASGKEASMLRKVLKPEALIVTPGITPNFAVKRDDQARVTTPKQAILNGADMIVVGSAIYKAENPAEAAEKIVAEIEEGLKELRCRHLALALHDCGAIKFGAFKLKLHDTQPDAPLSPFYINLRIVRSLPDLLNRVARAMLEKIQEDKIDFDIFSDIPTAVTPIVSVMVHQSKIPMVSPKISKTHGLAGDIDGLYELGQKLLLIDDLVTKADSKIEAAQILEKNKLIVKDIVVLFDREQGGGEALQQAGYKLHSVFKMGDTLKLYLDEGLIDQLKYDETIAYLKNN